MTPNMMPESHPNLSRELNDQVAESMIQGGADLGKLAIGGVVEATTRNTKYRIERVHDGEHDSPFLISGHPRICPEPKRAAISGSSYGGGMLRIGFIGRGMLMEFQLAGDDRSYTTTQVGEVVETAPSTQGTDPPTPGNESSDDGRVRETGDA